jgi:hypothetical protein
MNSKFLIVTLSLSFITACSKVKEFENKTASMERTTKEMSSTTSEMKSTTTTMYQQIRSKEAEDTRSKKFEILLNEEAHFGEKFVAAAVYFKSFEFQLWNANVSYEDVKNREELFLDAANEFTRKISDIYVEIDTQSMSPTKTSDRHNEEMAFYSIAATLHYLNSYQQDLVDKDSIKSTSFYDLIKTALLKDLNHEELDEHEIVLMSGINKEIMIELIKARIDILAALALKDLTDKRNMTTGQKLKAFFFNISGGRIGTIDLPEVFENSNEATKITITTRLEAAMKARNFLKEIGVSKELEKTIRSAFSNLDLESSSQEVKKADDNYKRNIRYLINNLLG